MVKVKRNLGYATITSPIDGVVISRAVEEGQTVAAGFETPTLFTIANDLCTHNRVAGALDYRSGVVNYVFRPLFRLCIGGGRSWLRPAQLSGAGRLDGHFRQQSGQCAAPFR